MTTHNQVFFIFMGILILIVSLFIGIAVSISEMRIHATSIPACAHYDSVTGAFKWSDEK